jgi:hypothetical protein
MCSACRAVETLYNMYIIVYIYIFIYLISNSTTRPLQSAENTMNFLYKLALCTGKCRGIPFLVTPVQFIASPSKKPPERIISDDHHSHRHPKSLR